MAHQTILTRDIGVQLSKSIDFENIRNNVAKIRVLPIYYNVRWLNKERLKCDYATQKCVCLFLRIFS